MTRIRDFIGIWTLSPTVTVTSVRCPRVWIVAVDGQDVAGLRRRDQPIVLRYRSASACRLISMITSAASQDGVKAGPT